jgi:hypothetical protein
MHKTMPHVCTLSRVSAYDMPRVKHLVMCQLLCYAKCQLLATSNFYVSVPCKPICHVLAACHLMLPRGIPLLALMPCVSCLPFCAAMYQPLVSPMPCLKCFSTAMPPHSVTCQSFLMAK